MQKLLAVAVLMGLTQSARADLTFGAAPAPIGQTFSPMFSPIPGLRISFESDPRLRNTNLARHMTPGYGLHLYNPHATTFGMGPSRPQRFWFPGSILSLRRAADHAGLPRQFVINPLQYRIKY